jgi:hypothetical protein
MRIYSLRINPLAIAWCVWPIRLITAGSNQMRHFDEHVRSQLETNTAFDQNREGFLQLVIEIESSLWNSKAHNAFARLVLVPDQICDD